MRPKAKSTITLQKSRANNLIVLVELELKFVLVEFELKFASIIIQLSLSLSFKHT